MEGLGRSYDLAVAVAPVDLSAGAKTGQRVSMKKCSSVAVVVFKDKGGFQNTDPQLTFKSYDASSAGNADTTTVTVDHYYKKSATSYDGTQTWTKVAITATATPTLSGEGSSGGLYVFEVLAAQLPDGYPYLEVDTSDAGTNSEIGGVLYIQEDLLVQRTPANLGSQLS
jgi:hypothetical protein